MGFYWSFRRGNSNGRRSTISRECLSLLLANRLVLWVMDQTELFRATVRTLKLRRKKQGAASPPPSSLSSDSRRSSSLFESSARDVVSLCTCPQDHHRVIWSHFMSVVYYIQVVFISKLQAFLLRHRKNYINSAK